MKLFSSSEEKPRSVINRIFRYIEKLSESDSLILKVLILALSVSVILLLVNLSTGWRTEIAADGGTITEGVVGIPRFINPVLAVTRADKDLSALIYDGLMILGEDGTLVPNIAESVTVSEDGLTYNVVMRRDATFHDDVPVTALDVVFTISRITEPSLTSPLRANFDGVTIEQVGDYELNFVLTEPYAPFIENLTFGILPEHVWKDVMNDEFPYSQRNSDPLGSGPYSIDKIVRNASSIPELYVLKPHKTYHRGAPKIEHLIFNFYANEDKLIAAFKDGQIDSIAGIDPSRLFELGIQSDVHAILRIPLPRTFAVFINQTKSPALRDKGARTALSVAIDRTELINTVLGGYGIPLSSPIPEGFGISVPASTTDTGVDAVEQARAILNDTGWKLNTESGVWEKDIEKTRTPLSVSIATVNNPLFEATAEFLRASWERLGVTVSIKQFEQSDLTQAIIRPRDYETLLFGTQVGRSLDFYSFWHSSQRNDPGLNVALYANITTDAALTEARTSQSIETREAALKKFADEIQIEKPAIFIYQPELLYVFPTRITGATFKGVSEAQERFTGVHNWYIETESIWSFLTSKTE
jgi:peptide/nickel transport system substrate-binding protein